VARRPQAVLALAAVVTLAAAGCGSDGPATVSGGPASAPPPTASSAVPTTATPRPATATETPTQAAPAPTTTATAPTATTGVPSGGGESQPGGAGDEEPARTPAAFRVGAAAITPRKVTVAAFLAVDVALTAQGQSRTIVLDAPGGGTFQVAAGGTRHVRLAGLKPGDYPLTSGGARATLHVVSGGAPGP
jgi:hypothetical protein